MHDLNLHTLIGNTDQRGHAWHYRAEDQGEESNHYPGPIPLPDVERRLFNWDAQARPLAVEVPADLETMTHLDGQGEPVRWAVTPDRQAITRSDNHHLMGIFTTGYQMHQYRTWLLDTVATVLDDDLCISSAGLLKQGAVAWVEVSIPDTVATPEGFDFRPNLLATTSFDGSIATTFKRTITATVCDNTLGAALSEKGQAYKVKHSRYSQAKIGEARDALAIVHTLAEDFANEITQLTQTTVTDQQWATFLDTTIPTTGADGSRVTGRAHTLADSKRARLESLYRHDQRVTPWAGTALGVLQAVNTYEHHHATIRGTQRPERNMLRTITGDFTQIDQHTRTTLNQVLATV